MNTWLAIQEAIISCKNVETPWAKIAIINLIRWPEVFCMVLLSYRHCKGGSGGKHYVKAQGEQLSLVLVTLLNYFKFTSAWGCVYDLHDWQSLPPSLWTCPPWMIWCSNVGYPVNSIRFLLEIDSSISCISLAVRNRPFVLLTGEKHVRVPNVWLFL